MEKFLTTSSYLEELQPYIEQARVRLDGFSEDSILRSAMANMAKDRRAAREVDAALKPPPGHS